MTDAIELYDWPIAKKAEWQDPAGRIKACAAKKHEPHASDVWKLFGFYPVSGIESMSWGIKSSELLYRSTYYVVIPYASTVPTYPYLRLSQGYFGVWVNIYSVVLM
jgi:hypothetical protein